LVRTNISAYFEKGLVSVIIPIYNYETTIKRVIEAIFASSYKNIEVIAVNDGSSDGTKDILDDLSKRFPNLKVLHQTNQGIRNAVAKGDVYSEGQFVILVDADRVVTENSIANIVDALTINPKVGARELSRTVQRILDQKSTSRIEITNHAKERAFERDVSYTEITQVMLNPTETIYDKVRDNYRSYAVSKKRYIVVVYTKLNSHVRIITVIPTDKKGVSKNGFRI
jgi:glycosyltransferase involved in cell wall biosynthesis